MNNVNIGYIRFSYASWTFSKVRTVDGGRRCDGLLLLWMLLWMYARLVVLSEQCIVIIIIGSKVTSMIPATSNGRERGRWCRTAITAGGGGTASTSGTAFAAGVAAATSCPRRLRLTK